MTKGLLKTHASLVIQHAATAQGQTLAETLYVRHQVILCPKCNIGVRADVWKKEKHHQTCIAYSNKTVQQITSLQKRLFEK